jgi:hypothetical protein
MEKQKLLNELEERFKRFKEELGFKCSLDDLDKIFYIRDFILERGYISTNVGSQIRRRIIDTYYSWIEHLHSLVIPNPANMLMMTESECFNEEEKKEITNLIKKTMALISRNSIIALKKDKKEEAGFIDDAFNFWNNEFRIKVLEFMERINKKWKE